MKQLASLFLLGLALLTTGCGGTGFASGPDRTALAKQTIKTYWADLVHGKFAAAYGLLTPGVRSGLQLKDYTQSMVGLLTRAATIQAHVKKATVSGNTATVKVKLTTPNDRPLIAYQHLFWQNGKWRVSDNNAFLSRKP